VVLVTDRVTVVARGGDLEQEWLPACPGGGVEHVDHVAGLVRVQFVDGRAMHAQAERMVKADVRYRFVIDMASLDA